MAFSDTLTHALPAIGGIAFGPMGAAGGTLLAGALGQANANEQDAAAKAAQNAIPMYDPTQLSFMNDTRRTERAFQAGTDPNTSNAIRQAVQAGGQVGANLVRAGGPDVTQNLLRGLSATQQAIGKYSAAAGSQSLDVMAMRGRLVDNMAERVYSQQRMRADDLMAKAARTRQDANNNMLAAVPMLPQVGAEKTGGGKGIFSDIFGKSLSSYGQPSAQPQGALGGDWRTEGTGGPVPQSPSAVTQYPLYSRVSGQYPQAPTSGYDMGQQVML